MEGDPYWRTQRLMVLQVATLLSMTFNMIFFATEDRHECRCFSNNTLLVTISNESFADCVSPGCELGYAEYGGSVNIIHGSKQIKIHISYE